MMGLKEPKIFTLDEARQTLAFVKRIVVDIMTVHEQLEKLEPQIQFTNNLTERRYKLFLKDRLKYQLEEYQHELDMVGCHLKNPHLGLVGYYWDVGNGLVGELCWRYGEEDIYYWQEIGHDELIPLERLVPPSQAD